MAKKSNRQPDQSLLFGGADEPPKVGPYGQRVVGPAAVAEPPRQVAREPFPGAESGASAESPIGPLGDQLNALLTAISRAIAFITADQPMTARSVLQGAKEDVEKDRAPVVVAAIVAAGDLWYADRDEVGRNGEEIRRGVMLQFKDEDDFGRFLEHSGPVNAMWHHERDGVVATAETGGERHL